MRIKPIASLSILAASLAIVSCSENETHDTPAQNDGAIRFAPRTEYNTRSGDITTNNLGEFHVYAYTGTDDAPVTFMDNVEVTKTSSNTWAYSPLKYWPNEPVDFFAYAPAGWVPASGPLKPVEYSNYPPEKDLIYSTSMNNMGNAAVENAQVILNFRHALSKVTLNLSSTNTDLTVKATNVVMANLMSKGEFNFPKATTNAGANPADSTIGTWTNLSTPLTTVFFMAQRPEESLVLNTTPTDMSAEGMGGDKYFIPQTLTYRSNGSGADTYIAVMCNIYDANTGQKLWPNQNTPPENLVPGSTNKDGLLKFALGTPQFQAWKPGYHYIYNLVINTNPEMGSIDFGTPTVDTFVEVETNYE